MSRTDRAADYVRSLSGPEAFFYAGTLAGIDQGPNRPREWGQGALGYTRRFGNASAENIIGNTLQHGWTRITGTMPGSSVAAAPRGEPAALDLCRGGVRSSAVAAFPPGQGRHGRDLAEAFREGR